MLVSIFRSISKYVKHQDSVGTTIKYLGWFFLVSVIFVVLFKVIEDVSWDESIWQMWQTATTVGYGNEPAETVAGRILTMIAGTMGIALVGVLISGAFEIKQHFEDLRRYGMNANPFKDGYVLINFPGAENFRVLANEIRTAEPDVGICIVDGIIEEIPTSIVAEIANLHFIKGHALSRQTCEMARVKDNKAVLIFPLDKNTSDSDGTTLAIYSLISKQVTNKTRIIPMLVSAANEELFKDFYGEGKIVGTVWQNLDLLALVQECQDPHSAEIICQLLANTKGANPETVIPNRIAGWTWLDLVYKSAKLGRNKGVRINPFAIVHEDGSTETCPDPDYVLKKTDNLSVIAFPGFDWDKYEEKLSKVD